MTNLSQCSDIMLPIPGYEGLYMAHRHGFIISCPQQQNNKGRTNRRGNNLTCLRPFDNGRGYLHVSLCVGGERKNFRVHRLVAMAYIANLDGKPYINHKNGNKKDNRVENLEWCTQKENVGHAIATMLYTPGLNLKSGAEAFRAKFNNNQIAEIRSSPERSIDLARRYSVSDSTICRIRKLKRYI